MLKAVLIGATALAIGGSTFVVAQQRSDRDSFQRFRVSPDDVQAYGEARLAALKAGLALTSDQESNWPAFAAAARDLIKLRSDQLAARRSRAQTPGGGYGGDGQGPNGSGRTTQPGQTDPIERLRQRATVMRDTGAALQKVADTTDPLYKSLDEGQKRRFVVLTRLTGLRMAGGGFDRSERPDRRDGGFAGRERGFGDRDGRERRRFDERDGRGFDRGSRGLFYRFHPWMGRGFGGRDDERDGRFGRDLGSPERFGNRDFRGREDERGFRGREDERSERFRDGFRGRDDERGFREREGRDGRDGNDRDRRFREDGFGRGPRRFDDGRDRRSGDPDQERTYGGPQGRGEDL